MYIKEWSLIVQSFESSEIRKNQQENRLKNTENFEDTAEIHIMRFNMNRIINFVVTAAVLILLLTPTAAEARANFSKHAVSRIRRTVTGLRTQCIPYLKNFCQMFTFKGVTKRFCIAKTFYTCTALDWSRYRDEYGHSSCSSPSTVRLKPNKNLIATRCLYKIYQGVYYKKGCLGTGLILSGT